MMRLSRYGGNQNLGVFSVANESLAIISPDASEEYVKNTEEALGVKTILTTVAGSFVVGSLVAMNSNYAIVSELAEEDEIKAIEKHIPVFLLHSRYNAAGNNILINDNGAIINPNLSDDIIHKMENTLGIKCVRSTIAGMDTVGSACKATNKGVACHPNTTAEELALIKDVLKVEAVRTTLNHGSVLIGPCLIANSKGALIGDTSTPIELGKLEDALNLF